MQVIIVQGRMAISKTLSVDLALLLAVSTSSLLEVDQSCERYTVILSILGLVFTLPNK